MKPIRLELPTEFAVGSVNAFLFMDPEPTLIDTGVKLDACWQALVDGLAKHDLYVADIKRVIITHAHVDHFGQARRIQQESDAELWVADVGADWLRYFPDFWQKRVRYYRDEFLPTTGLDAQTQAGVVAYFEWVASHYQALPDVKAFSINQPISLGGVDWQVLHTPGHASTQTCFYQPESKQLLASDMILWKTPVPVVERPFPPHTTRAPALLHYMQSLDHIAQLEVDIAYPGHGKPITELPKLIHRQRKRIHARKEECYALLAGSAQSAAQLMNQMYADRPPQLRFAGLWMLLGYLDLLQAENRVSVHMTDGVHFYAQNT